jgi:methylated-DNA-protein-cysteine methyltransferase-like protein
MWTPPNPKRFNALVYACVAKIPYGKVATYGQIASLIPPDMGEDPDQYHRLGARWVGQALRQTPADVDIPWHRVVNSQGRISLRVPADAYEQQVRLEAEGVVFSGAGRINLKIFRWNVEEIDFDEDLDDV